MDAEVFRRAGKALDGRPKRGHIDPANRAMLSGVLACPVCEDSPMYRLASGYYRCTGRGANRRGCGNMVRVDAADAAVNRAIAEDFATPVMAHAVIPGNEARIAARLEEIRFEVRQLGSADLDDAEYDRRLAGLRAERDQVKAAEVVPDRVELTDTGEVYSELWARTPGPRARPVAGPARVPGVRLQGPGDGGAGGDHGHGKAVTWPGVPTLDNDNHTRVLSLVQARRDRFQSCQDGQPDGIR